MKYLPPPCKGGCGRPVRPKGADKDEWGGALISMARGMCNACYRAAPRVYALDHSTECADCKRPFRPTKTSVQEYPETVARHCAGRCQSCHKMHIGKTTTRLSRRPDNCAHCERKLRPKGRDVEEFPGTVEHAGKGMCTTCKTDVVRGKAPEPRRLGDVVSTPTPRTEFQEVTDPGLLRLRAQRAERKRRQEQMHRVRVAQEAARARFLQTRRAA